METEYKPWLHTVQNAGVTKRKKAKQLTRQQKVRQQRALEKADAVVDKLDRKVANSKARSKKVQARAKDWDELNEEFGKKSKQPDHQTSASVEPAAAAAEDPAETSEDISMPNLEPPLPTHGADGDLSEHRDDPQD